MSVPTDRSPSEDSSNYTSVAPGSLAADLELAHPSIRVADAMTVGPRTCSPMSTVLEAVMIFRDADCGSIPVTDSGKPLGVLTDRDVALAVADYEQGLSRRPVGELMKKDIVTIHLDATLDDAMSRLGDSGVRRLLVVDDDEVLQGILSWTDLIPHLTERGIGRVVSRIIENRA